jgi:exonuclease III
LGENCPVEMKIATFNVNNINKRLPALLEWLKLDASNYLAIAKHF